jgi:hypothetical protein
MVDKWLDQVDGEDVRINAPYKDSLRGGMLVRAISKSKDGDTTVEYVKKDGTLGKYLATTTYLSSGLDPVQSLIYCNLFSDYRKIYYKEKFSRALIGDFDLGDFVKIQDSNKIGIVYGFSLDSTDRKSKVIVQYVSQLGTLEFDYVGKYELETVNDCEDDFAIFYESMITFGYKYDRDRKMIIKYGDRYPAYHQDGWDIGNYVEKRDNPSAHGVIVKKDGRYSYVKFIGRKSVEKVPMTNLSWIQTSNSRTLDKLGEILKEYKENQDN